MQFLFNSLSETDKSDTYPCSIPIYVRFMIALCILAVALVVSVCIKLVRTEDLVPLDAEKDSLTPPMVTGRLVSIPKDFTLRTQEDITKQQELEFTQAKQIHHATAKPIVEVTDSPTSSYPQMVKTYEQAQITPSVSSDSSTFVQKSDVVPTRVHIKDNVRREPNYRYHKTCNGDKLDNLAELYLHDKERWPEIYKLNQDTLTNKDVIPIGIILLIPEK